MILMWSPIKANAQVRQVTFDVDKLYDKRDPYFPQYNLLGGHPSPTEDQPKLGEYWSYNVNLGVKTDLYAFDKFRVYWDQNIIGYSTNVQYRKVTWDWELGARTGQYVDLFWHHRSEHGLETNLDQRYPIEDVYGIRFYLYRK